MEAVTTTTRLVVSVTCRRDDNKGHVAEDRVSQEAGNVEGKRAAPGEGRLTHTLHQTQLLVHTHTHANQFNTFLIH